MKKRPELVKAAREALYFQHKRPGDLAAIPYLGNVLIRSNHEWQAYEMDYSALRVAFGASAGMWYTEDESRWSIPALSVMLAPHSNIRISRGEYNREPVALAPLDHDVDPGSISSATLRELPQAWERYRQRNNPASQRS